MKPVALWPHVCLVVASLAPSALAAPSTTSKPSSAASAAPSSASPATAADAQELAKLLATFDALWVDNKTYAEIEMKIVTKNYSRNLAMNYWGDGKDKSLIKISAPPKEKGVATLKVGNDVYNYLPKVARTIKLGQALLGQSWMGSHFTNSDLVQATRLTNDYTAKLTAKTKDATGAEVWTATMTAKPATVTPWKTLVLKIVRSTQLPLEQQFFDQDKNLARTIYYREPRDFSGKRIPSLVRVEPKTTDLSGESTEMRYVKINRKAALDADLFQLSTLTNQ